MKLLILQAVTTAERLPFRESDPSMGPLLFKALVFTTLLLALAFGLLVLARRQGWLPAPAQGAKNRDIEIRSSRRVTPHTTVIVIRRGQQEFLLVESTRQISVQAVEELPLEPAEIGE